MMLKVRQKIQNATFQDFRQERIAKRRRSASEYDSEVNGASANTFSRASTFSITAIVTIDITDVYFISAGPGAQYSPLIG